MPTDGTTTTRHEAAADHLSGLLPHHLSELRASGLSDETIRAAEIQSETRYERLAAILNWTKYQKRMGPCVVYPYKTAEGINGYYRLKPDVPRLIGGKPAKYESPKGRSNELYLPPGVSDVLDKPDVELLITEGEKKSLKATQDGFHCLGLVGVYGWKDGKSARMLPALERITWKGHRGRKVYIVFDSDAADNDKVRAAESQLAMYLGKRGAIVRVVRLPPADDGKVGLDDYLIAHGPDGLRTLIDGAQEPDAPDANELAVDARTLDPATEAATFLKINIQDDLPCIRFWRGTFWTWDAGNYREQQNAEVRGQLIRNLNKTYSRLTTNVTGNVFDQLRAQGMLSGQTEPPAWLGKKERPFPADEVLACKNQLVHLPSLVEGLHAFSIPATPRFFTTAALDYDFIINAPFPATWLDFLYQLWGDDQQTIEALQDWFGYCLTADTRQQKILLMVGPTRSGKGVIARLLRALIGTKNAAGPTLASFGTNFGLWPLVGKSLAIVNDARLSGRPDQAAVVERLLSISGEDSLTIDRKNLEPVTGKLSARLMIISNELPRLADSSGALTGRMIMLLLKNTFYGREDQGLTTKLLAELPGILLWAIGGWRRLRERGHFIQPDAALEMLAELADLTSPTGAFVREVCLVGPAYRAAVDDLFTAWEKWCEDNGRKESGTLQTFGRDLLAAVPGLRRVQPREGEIRYRAYEGIGIKSGCNF